MQNKISKDLKSILSAFTIFVFSGMLVGLSLAQAAEPGKTQKITGKITNISQKAKTIALENSSTNFFLLQFTDKTAFKNNESIKDFAVTESITAEYKNEGEEHIAISIEKELVKLPPGIREIKTEELLEKMRSDKKLVVIDARPGGKYAEGHIPGAISIPLSKLVEAGENGQKLLLPYKDNQLIFYCGGPTCTMSPKSASLAKKWGHKDPSVYVDGIPKWKKMGHKTLPSVEYLDKGNIVLIDLRDSEKIEKGHIPRAFSIPFKQIEDSEDALPTNTGAPIYLYSDLDNDVSKASKQIKEWGYKNVNGVYGGLELWTGAGKKLETGPAKIATDDAPITWERQLGPGEISISDFTKSLKFDLIFVVDARTPAEYESGHFPKAVNIPLEQMKHRMKEIPQDKFIIVHCKTGGRGEIGYRLLKGAGYAVKFLNAECECSSTGEYDIW